MISQANGESLERCHMYLSPGIETQEEMIKTKKKQPKKKNPNTDDEKEKQNMVSRKRWKQIENCVLQV